jgi:hypothetical protein
MRAVAAGPDVAIVILDMKRALLSVAIAAVLNAVPFGYVLILPAQTCNGGQLCEPSSAVQGAGIVFAPGILLTEIFGTIAHIRNENVLSALAVATNTACYAAMIWWLLSRRARRQEEARRTLPL